MPVTVDWYDDEKQIIYYRFEGLWSWAQFLSGWERVGDLLDSIDHEAHIIGDFTRSLRFPADLVRHIRETRRLAEQHPRAGLVVVIGVDWYIQTLWRFLTGIMPGIQFQPHFVDTLDEALALIAAHRSGPDQADSINSP
jgi:hypothetical protein